LYENKSYQLFCLLLEHLLGSRQNFSEGVANEFYSSFFAIFD
jgi:hypothetical protein